MMCFTSEFDEIDEYPIFCSVCGCLVGGEYPCKKVVRFEASDYVSIWFCELCTPERVMKKLGYVQPTLLTCEVLFKPRIDYVVCKRTNFRETYRLYIEYSNGGMKKRKVTAASYRRFLRIARKIGRPYGQIGTKLLTIFWSAYVRLGRV